MNNGLSLVAASLERSSEAAGRERLRGAAREGRVRASRGMRPKRAERRFLLHQTLSRHHAVTLERVSLAYDVVDAAFRNVWHDHHVTWTVRQRLSVLLEGVQLSLPEAGLAGLVRLH